MRERLKLEKDRCNVRLLIVFVRHLNLLFNSEKNDSSPFQSYSIKEDYLISARKSLAVSTCLGQSKSQYSCLICGYYSISLQTNIKNARVS